MNTELECPVERYQIIFYGLDQDSPNQKMALASLSKLCNVSPEKIVKLLDGQPRTIKKNLNWEGACQYWESIQLAGGSGEIRIMLDEQCLREGKVSSKRVNSGKVAKNFCSKCGKFLSHEGSLHYCSTSDSRGETTGYEPTLEACQELGFSRIHIAPSLFYFSYHEPVFNAAHKKLAYLSSLNATLSDFGALLISTGIGFFMQYHFLYSDITSLVGTGSLFSVLSLFLLLACIVFLPSIISPRRKLRLSRTREEKELIFSCLQIRKLSPFTKMFEVKGSDHKHLAVMSRNKITRWYKCHDPEGKLILQAKEERDLNDIALSAGAEIRESLISIKILDLLQNISIFRSSKCIVIRDDKQNVLGTLSLGPFCRLNIYNDKAKHVDRRILVSFGALLTGI